METYLLVTNNNFAFSQWIQNTMDIELPKIQVSSIEDIKNLSCEGTSYKIVFLEGHRDTEIFNSMEAQAILKKLSDGIYKPSLCHECEYFHRLPNKNLGEVETCMSGKRLHNIECNSYEKVNLKRRDKDKMQLSEKVRLEKVITDNNDLPVLVNDNSSLWRTYPKEDIFKFIANGMFY